MSIKFTVQKKTNPTQPKAEEKYYAKAIADGELPFENLLEIISRKSNLHMADCIKFMMLLEETIHEELKDGKIVRLGDIGNFQIGISSKGVATELKVTANTITSAKVNFRVGKGFRTLLKELDFKKVKM